MNHNTGNWNTGDWNTGNRNTGNRNTGDWNTGNRNTGYRNTGNRNTGNWNTGNWNIGNRNTGYRNTGNWNIGDFNTGDFNTGYCNSITPDDCYIFNKPSKRSLWDSAEKPKWMFIDLTKWVEQAEMTDKEKEAYPSYVTTGGYLKCYPDLRTTFIESWENTTEEDRELTKKLPNFDPVEFEKVFEFNPFKEVEAVAKTIEIDGKKYQLIEVEND
jgi:hypothetical protein